MRSKGDITEKWKKETEKYAHSWKVVKPIFFGLPHVPRDEEELQNLAHVIAATEKRIKKELAEKVKVLSDTKASFIKCKVWLEQVLISPLKRK